MIDFSGFLVSCSTISIGLPASVSPIPPTIFFNISINSPFLFWYCKESCLNEDAILLFSLLIKNDAEFSSIRCINSLIALIVSFRC